MPEREERVRFAAFLNVVFTILEVVGGFWTNSLAILSDALHDFGDSIDYLFRGFSNGEHAGHRTRAERSGTKGFLYSLHSSLPLS